MPLIASSNYTAPFLLKNGHLQTIIPALFRDTNGVNYRRERISTPDDDFIDLDWSTQNKDTQKLVILTHGLEGNSSSKYLLGMVRALNKAGYDTLSWNMRSCSGESNKQVRFYHSGAIDDLDVVINHAAQKYGVIYLIGFSLGGNITLNYLGKAGTKIQQANIQKGIAFSVPCHLESCAINMEKIKNKVYLNRFLKSLRSKMVLKAELNPGTLLVDNIDQINNFVDFDERFTGPIHGFEGAKDYYLKCSSLYVLKNIRIPTLLVNAQNDPFLSAECFPYKEAMSSSYFHFEAPRSGGHCGFITLGSTTNWAEKRAIEFLEATV
jgi:predicted alpha/beta-fold hydrolase